MHKHAKITVIVAAVVLIAGAGAVYFVSPLFISAQVNEPLPTSALQSEPYQRFISTNEVEKMQAAKQMSSQERDDIKMGGDPGEIKITVQGKNKPEYQLRD